MLKEVFLAWPTTGPQRLWAALEEISSKKHQKDQPNYLSPWEKRRSIKANIAIVKAQIQLTRKHFLDRCNRKEPQKDCQCNLTTSKLGVLTTKTGSFKQLAWRYEKMDNLPITCENVETQSVLRYPKPKAQNSERQSSHWRTAYSPQSNESNSNLWRRKFARAQQFPVFWLVSPAFPNRALHQKFRLTGHCVEKLRLERKKRINKI